MKLPRKLKIGRRTKAAAALLAVLLVSGCAKTEMSGQEASTPTQSINPSGQEASVLAQAADPSVQETSTLAQPVDPTQAADLPVQEATTPEQAADLPVQEASTPEQASESGPPEYRAAEEIAALTMLDVMYQGGPDWGTYEEMCARPGVRVTEQEGIFAGSPAMWSTVEDTNFVYFFARIEGEPDASYEYSNYAILNEALVLSCGVHTGMTAAEAEALIPGLYRYEWDDTRQVCEYNWNCGTYPDGWCEQFSAVLTARVENEVDLPYCVGFMLDEQDQIRAISFCWVTAG